MPIPLLQTTFDGLYLNSRTFLFGKMMEWVGIFFVVSLRHKHNGGLQIKPAPGLCISFKFCNFAA